MDLAAGESVEAAVRRAGFEEVWDVLQSLQEQDHILAALIRCAAEQKGRGQALDHKIFSEIIDFGGSHVELDALKATIAAYCLDELLPRWYLYIGKLRVFRERFGHSNVPIGWAEDPDLASWLLSVKSRYSKGQLSIAQIQELAGAGVAWSDRLQRNYQRSLLFREMSMNDHALPAQTQASSRAQKQSHKFLADLKKYKSKYGSLDVPKNYEPSPRLWKWIASIRTQYSNGNMPSDSHLIDELDALGFEWERIDETWRGRIAQLRSFKERFGHYKIEPDWEEDPSLATWVADLRIRRKRGMLNDDQIRQLDNLKFDQL